MEMYKVDFQDIYRILTDNSRNLKKRVFSILHYKSIFGIYFPQIQNSLHCV